MPAGSWEILCKRLVDILISTIGLFIFLPFFPFITLVILLDSPGPAFFFQERAGLHGKPFKIIKFRTMVLDAESKLCILINTDVMNEPVFKLRQDPRITRVGKILRRWSIDEIPQLINVLRGEMSLVGPRPEETWLVNRYTAPQRQRLAVKPGLTGPMQIAGRGELDFASRLDLELDYIRSFSLKKDFKIILNTIPAVISGKGAY